MKIVLTTFAAFAFILNAAALRADGGDASLIHACVAKDGTMRIVSATTACKNNEIALHWATLGRIVADETRITNTENTNASQNTAIAAIETINSQQDAAIAALQSGSNETSGAVITPPNAPYVFGSRVNVSFTSSSTVYDTDSYVGTNQLVIPDTGNYLLTMRGFNTLDSSFLALYYSVNNGTDMEICFSLGTSVAWPFCNGSELLNLNAGDTIKFATYSSSNNVADLRFGISKQ
ncbi:MAG: hypothetical protein ACM3SP_14225 [Chloroflexota bacterium]